MPDEHRLVAIVRPLERRITIAQMASDLCEHDGGTASWMPEIRIFRCRVELLRRADRHELEPCLQDGGGKRLRREKRDAVSAPTKLGADHDKRQHVTGGSNRRKDGVHRYAIGTDANLTSFCCSTAAMLRASDRAALTACSAGCVV